MRPEQHEKAGPLLSNRGGIRDPDHSRR